MHEKPINIIFWAKKNTFDGGRQRKGLNRCNCYRICMNKHLTWTKIQLEGDLSRGLTTNCLINTGGFEDALEPQQTSESELNVKCFPEDKNMRLDSPI
jgi:hypothetical protein